MGSDQPPFMANLFLHYFENKWLLNIKIRDLHKSRLFSNMFRFIDNLCVISDHLEFDRNFKNIYPTELQLKKENISTSEASFLDLSIIIENNISKTQLYDKRDAFAFSIVRMPHLDRNIPSNIYYATIGSAILIFARTTSEVNCLLKKMQKQGSKHRSAISMLNKMIGKY